MFIPINITSTPHQPNPPCPFSLNVSLVVCLMRGWPLSSLVNTSLRGLSGFQQTINLRVVRASGLKNKQTVNKSRCNSHTVVCNLNVTLFSRIEAHLNLKLGGGGGEGTILYTEFFSIKNSTPRGWGVGVLFFT